MVTVVLSAVKRHTQAHARHRLEEKWKKQLFAVAGSKRMCRSLDPPRRDRAYPRGFALCSRKVLIAIMVSWSHERKIRNLRQHL